jgi:hypothetical protein
MPDLIDQIVKAAREKWPDATRVDVSGSDGGWDVDHGLVRSLASVEVLSFNHGQLYYHRAPDLPSLLAKLQGTNDAHR